MYLTDACQYNGNVSMIFAKVQPSHLQKLLIKPHCWDSFTNLMVRLSHVKDRCSDINGVTQDRCSNIQCRLVCLHSLRVGTALKVNSTNVIVGRSNILVSLSEGELSKSEASHEGFQR